MSMSCSLAWQTQLPDATAEDTSLYPSAVPKMYWKERCTVEKPAETQTSLPDSYPFGQSD
jgi:hypothetical protein